MSPAIAKNLMAEMKLLGMLSAFDKVLVEARLSKSGQATAQPGDLQALSDVVSTRASHVLTLRITKVIT